jgi:hypothetical protein
VARLWELAALGLALVAAGALLAGPGLPDPRLAALAAIVGGCLLMARVSRRRS